MEALAVYVCAALAVWFLLAVAVGGEFRLWRSVVFAVFWPVAVLFVAAQAFGRSGGMR